MSQKAFDLAAKQEQTILIIIIERFDTEDIPRTKHGFGFWSQITKVNMPRSLPGS